ncbi:hypothetical protein IWW54_000083 [Coemansia sp. RSA 2705]|nr:hypothetical protein IWW54_000083 [Coemansia sp. RSA 2705]
MAKFSDLHDDIVGYILEELTEDVVEDAELWSSSLYLEPLPNVKTVSVHSSISDYLSSDYTLAEAETAAVEDAVNVFTRHIPGTTQLSIVCDRVHLAVHRFITALFYAYESSLDAFIYNELYGLNTTIDFVFKLLLMLCELKQLKINSLQMPNNEQRTSHNYLRNLRDSLGQPSSAKLEWFTLITRPSFDVDYLDATTKLLKWYLPQLKYVLIPSE